jgi:mRNA-degrading endonuclease RelE of RelBE toxin-antitoxin system
VDLYLEMPHRIIITHEAKAQLPQLSARAQRIVDDGIVARLIDQPTRLSRAVKQLRPNPLAAYELRLGDLRILYNVDQRNDEVTIVLLGRKVGNTLEVEGKEYHGHQTDPVE